MSRGTILAVNVGSSNWLQASLTAPVISSATPIRSPSLGGVDSPRGNIDTLVTLAASTVNRCFLAATGSPERLAHAADASAREELNRMLMIAGDLGARPLVLVLVLPNRLLEVRATSPMSAAMCGLIGLEPRTARLAPATPRLSS